MQAGAKPLANKVTGSTLIATTLDSDQSLDTALDVAPASTKPRLVNESAKADARLLNAPAHPFGSAAVHVTVLSTSAVTPAISATRINAQYSESSPQERDLLSQSIKPPLSQSDWQPSQSPFICQEAVTGLRDAVTPINHEAVGAYCAQARSTVDTLAFKPTTRASEIQLGDVRGEASSYLTRRNSTDSSTCNTVQEQRQVQSTRSDSSETSSEWGWFSSPDSSSE